MRHRLPSCRILEAILPPFGAKGWEDEQDFLPQIPFLRTPKSRFPLVFFETGTVASDFARQQRLFFHGVKAPASGPVQPVTFLPFGEHMLTTRAKGLNRSITVLLWNELAWLRIGTARTFAWRWAS
ncbi:hypothetical protein LR69_02416 [Geobacillus sp. BCO2]|nr:hypothetical protein LR69_02416 [Geobacillus sp. BCO2]